MKNIFPEKESKPTDYLWFTLSIILGGLITLKIAETQFAILIIIVWLPAIYFGTKKTGEFTPMRARGLFWVEKHTVGGFIIQWLILISFSLALIRLAYLIITEK